MTCVFSFSVSMSVSVTVLDSLSCAALSCDCLVWFVSCDSLVFCRVSRGFYSECLVLSCRVVSCDWLVAGLSCLVIVLPCLVSDL